MNYKKNGAKSLIRPIKKNDHQYTINDFFTIKIDREKMNNSMINDDYSSNFLQNSPISVFEETNLSSNLSHSLNINNSSDKNSKFKKKIGRSTKI